MRGTMALLLALALSACGGMSKPEKPPAELELLNRSAHLAFARGRYAQAATLYEAALAQALLQDRPQAIVDARFNLALAQTCLGRYPAALELVTLAEAERVRRSLAPDPELRLLRATIHYRAGDRASAQRMLDPLLHDTTVPAPTSARSHFLAGLLAADGGDAALLRSHRDALPAGESRDVQADRLELDARLAGLEGDTERALRQLDRAALQRSLDEDYRSMVRALAVAGAIAERAGRAEQAGGYWLRAGRSAVQRGEPDARSWLERARALGKDTGDEVLILEAEALLMQVGAGQGSQ